MSPRSWRVVVREFSAIKSDDRRQIIRTAFIASLPVLAGYSTMGFASGVLMAVKGGVPCPPFWAALLALSAVSGTLSFAMVPLMASGASALSAALLTLCVNFRYVFYGFSMRERWRGVPFFQKWFLVHSLADEIFALDLAHREEDPLKNRYYCLWNHFFNVSYWIFGTTAGAAVGAAFQLPSKGIEFAMPALFLVILTDQVRDLLARYKKGRENG